MNLTTPNIPTITLEYLIGWPFAIADFDNIVPSNRNLITSLIPSGFHCYRVLAVNELEDRQILQNGFLSGLLRQTSFPCLSELRSDSPIQFRVMEYVNGINTFDDSLYSDTLSIKFFEKSPRPGNSNIIGVYQNPLKAMAVGASAGVFQILSDARRYLNLYEIDCRNLQLCSVQAIFESSGLIPRFPVKGEFIVEGIIPPQAIKRIFRFHIEPIVRLEAPQEIMSYSQLILNRHE